MATSDKNTTKVEQINTLVVGAGQAGVATSEHLRNCGIEHVVLERSRIAERWRSDAGIHWWPMVQRGTIGFPV